MKERKQCEQRHAKKAATATSTATPIATLRTSKKTESNKNNNDTPSCPHSCACRSVGLCVCVRVCLCTMHTYKYKYIIHNAHIRSSCAAAVDGSQPRVGSDAVVVCVAALFISAAIIFQCDTPIQLHTYKHTRARTLRHIKFLIDSHNHNQKQEQH